MTNKLGSLYSHVFTCAACELPSANIWQPKTTPLATFRIDGSSWGGAGGGTSVIAFKYIPVNRGLCLLVQLCSQTVKCPSQGAP